MSYTIDVACSETSGSDWSINYNEMPGFAGTDCTISDFDSMIKQHTEAAFEKAIKSQAPSGETLSLKARRFFPSNNNETLIEASNAAAAMASMLLIRHGCVFLAGKDTFI